MLRDNAFKIVIDPKYDGYRRGLASMVYTCFDKRSKASGIINESNYQLLKKLRKEKRIHHLKTILGVLIYLICNH